MGGGLKCLNANFFIMLKKWGGGIFFHSEFEFFLRSSLTNYCKHFPKSICREFISPVGYFFHFIKTLFSSSKSCSIQEYLITIIWTHPSPTISFAKELLFSSVFIMAIKMSVVFTLWTILEPDCSSFKHKMGNKKIKMKRVKELV